MTDKPILFSGPMVRAILEGRKTQTRRLLRPQPDFRGGHGGYHDAEEWGWEDEDGYHVSVLDIAPNGYRAGDRLWVREACATWEGGHQDVVYRADETEQGWDDLRHDARTGAPWKLRTSIFMPRWASRLTLTVTDVRVQRLRDITLGDLYAEGCATGKDDMARGLLPQGWQGPWDEFRDLWDSLNAKRAPWESNPWVAAVTFRAVPANIDSVEAGQ